MPRAVANDLPDWLEPHLEAVYGRAARSTRWRRSTRRRRLDLRVNLLKADRETARRALAAEDIAAEPTPLVAARPAAARIACRSPAPPPSRRGSSRCRTRARRLAALLADARPGMRVVDFCAGAGGKTLALAAGMETAASSSPATSSAWRLERAGAAAAPRRHQQCRAPRADRASATPGSSITQGQLRPGVRRCAVPRHRHLAAQPRRQMARSPRGPRRAGRCASSEILRSAARLVKPGRPPRSMRPARCCARRTRRRPKPSSPPHADFALLSGGARLGRDDRRRLPAGDDYLRLTPARHGTDGFFVAIFERASRQPTLTASGGGEHRRR